MNGREGDMMLETWGGLRGIHLIKVRTLTFQTDQQELYLYNAEYTDLHYTIHVANVEEHIGWQISNISISSD